MIADWQKRDWSHWTYYTSWPALRRVLDRLVYSGAQVGLSRLVPRVPVPAARDTHFTPEALNALLSTPCPAWLRCLVLLCHDCGLRARTALNLRPSQYDATNRSIATRTKQGRSVSVPVSPRLAALLAIAPLGEVPFVPALAGVRGISYGSARLHFVNLCADAGLPRGYGLHDLRRTVARNLWGATHSIGEVQSLLGHSSPKTTIQYLASAVFSVRPANLALVTGGDND